jgi:hypothetical protein
MHDTKDTIERRLTAVKSQRSSGELEDLALIIGDVYHWVAFRSRLNCHRWEKSDIRPGEGGVGFIFRTCHHVQSSHLL